MNNLLTVFTPTYNRLHTLRRTFDSLLRQTCNDFNWLVIDDGSTDGTQEWVESLGKKTIMRGMAYDWMGRATGYLDNSHFVIEVVANSGRIMAVEYVKKTNGGLYTGYNAAFSTIQSELCVCVDSDDYMPNDAVSRIAEKWFGLSLTEKPKVAGLVGLDYNVVNKQPIGGPFETDKEVEWVHALHHQGDTKFVLRTELMRKVAPQIGFDGEKDFNPHYMQMQVLDEYPIVVMNKNLCWVEYQIGADSMSQAIFKQYMRSPRSYAKYRIMEMKMKHGNGIMNRFRLSSHYVSSCIFSSDKQWLKRSPCKLLTVLSLPVGILLNLYIRIKAR